MYKKKKNTWFHKNCTIVKKKTVHNHNSLVIRYSLIKSNYMIRIKKNNFKYVQIASSKYITSVALG